MHNSSKEVGKHAIYLGHWDLKKHNAQFLSIYAQKQLISAQRSAILVSLSDRNPVLEVHRQSLGVFHLSGGALRQEFSMILRWQLQKKTALRTKLRETITNSKKSLSCEQKNSKIKQGMRLWREQWQ